MYERFTDRARKAMQLANQEAQRLNHEYIGTEHVLLGLVKEGHGVASLVLRDYGVGLGEVRLEAEKRMQPGPEMIAMGKLPHTPRTKAVIESAIQIAKDFDHSYVGTEHMLLALSKETDGLASQILTALGVEYPALLGSVKQQHGEAQVSYEVVEALKAQPTLTEQLSLVRHALDALATRLEYIEQRIGDSYGENTVVKFGAHGISVEEPAE